MLVLYVEVNEGPSVSHREGVGEREKDAQSSGPDNGRLRGGGGKGGGTLRSQGHTYATTLHWPTRRESGGRRGDCGNGMGALACLLAKGVCEVVEIERLGTDIEDQGCRDVAPGANQVWRPATDGQRSRAVIGC